MGIISKYPFESVLVLDCELYDYLSLEWKLGNKTQKTEILGPWIIYKFSGEMFYRGHRE